MAATDAGLRSETGTSMLGHAMAWWVWILAVTFVVYLFSFQTGYSIVNPSVQKDTGISIAQVVQDGAGGDEPVWVVVLTHEAREGGVREALAEIDRLPVVRAGVRLIRIAG